ncbi:uncharacterized protein BDV17DRAFT_282146 [Aspergillus undulatus]|uniref:uncharacterized protein n=1 Tax=Aspergillus undulatus TaxID=1810928 RepID=UPI003CCCD79E
MAESDSHALVFGAAGLLGWATLNQLLSNYPSTNPFPRVTAVLNRPVPEPDLYLPSGPDRPSLQIISKIDLMHEDGYDLANQLRERVDGVEGVTHVFYFVFSPVTDNHEKEVQQNCAMMQRVVDALNITCPKMQSFVYPGGSRGYGIYEPSGIFSPPLTESLANKLPPSYAKTVSYPWFRKLLTEASKGKDKDKDNGKNWTWTWTEICPDAVVGFTPNGSGYSLALHWAQYLSLYAFNHGAEIGEGKEVEIPFPGNEAGYRSLFTPVSGRILGRIAIHAALNPGQCGGKVINMLDCDKPVSMSEMWPGIAAWLGLKGVGPVGDEDVLKPGEYIEKHAHLFEENGRPKGLTCGVGAGNNQLDAYGWWLGFDRHFSPDRLRSVGFTEQRDPIKGWLEAFEGLGKAGIIF